MSAKAGDWVQIYDIMLKPEERAPNVPVDTKKVGLEMRMKGYLLKDSKIGEWVKIKTVTGRIVEGKLVAVNPGFGHSFGRPVPELFGMREKLRQLIK